MLLHSSLTAEQGLFLSVGAISFLALLGAIFGYVAFKRIKHHEVLFMSFSAFLMALLGIYLLLLSLIDATLYPGAWPYACAGFAFGACIAWIGMYLSMALSHREDGSRFAIMLFFMLMIHEIVEGMAVADIFFEMSGQITFLATFISLGMLAFHEFPEGMALVLPFFLAGERKRGFATLFANIFVFAVSAVLFYFYFLDMREPHPKTEILLATIPAGGILLLGIYEARDAFKNWSVYAGGAPRILLVVLCLTLSAIASFGILHALEHAELKRGVRISGYELSPSGELIPVIYGDPCQHRANFEDCFH